MKRLKQLLNQGDAAGTLYALGPDMRLKVDDDPDTDGMVISYEHGLAWPSFQPLPLQRWEQDPDNPGQQPDPPSGEYAFCSLGEVEMTPEQELEFEDSVAQRWEKKRLEADDMIEGEALMMRRINYVVFGLACVVGVLGLIKYLAEGF